MAPPFIYTPLQEERRLGEKNKASELILLNLKIEGMIGKTGLKQEQRFFLSKFLLVERICCYVLLLEGLKYLYLWQTLIRMPVAKFLSP